MSLSENFLSLHCDHEHLIAYKAACEEHPALKSYDSSLQEQTYKAAVKLADESKNKVVSPYTAYKVVSQHAIDTTEGVANFITESDFNFRESEALNGLVETYFESTKKTLGILTTIEKCVKDAEMGQLYLREAVLEFNKEKNAGGKKNKYEKTLKCVNKFKALGDPFSGKVLTNQFEMIMKHYKSLMEAVKETREKLEKEIADLEKALLITNVVSGFLIAGLFIAAIAFMATGVGAAVIEDLAVAGIVVTAGWVEAYTVLNEKIKVLKKQLDPQLLSVDEAIKLENFGMETISPEVNVLEQDIKEMLELAGSATEDEGFEAKTRLCLEKICGKVEDLTKIIKDVGGSVEAFIILITDARIRVLQKINS